MADTPLSESTRPFRESVRVFAEAGAFVRRLGDDLAYWQYLQALRQLPSSSTFHPFDVTALWSTDESEPGQPSSHNRSSQGAAGRIPRRQAEPRQRLAVVNRSPASSSQRVQAPTSHVDRPHALVVPREPTSVAGGPESGLAADGWSALSRIARLLMELEPSGMQPATAGRTIEQQPRHGAVARPSLPQLTGTAQPHPTGTAQASRHAPATRMAGSSQSQVDAGVSRESGGNPQTEDRVQSPALSQLADAVATLWQTEGGARPLPEGQTIEEARPSVPVPRAPSLLVAAAVASASQQVAERGATSAALERGGSSTTAPTDAGADQEPLAERLNRALIEQAWLRGVDLA